MEVPLEKGIAAHSSTLAWRIPWTENPGGVQSIDPQTSEPTEQLTLSLSHRSLLKEPRNIKKREDKRVKVRKRKENAWPL